MRHYELFESYRAPLYHALSAEHAITALIEDRLLATSSQRFWSNGKRLKDNHPDYKKSFWRKGISLTRDIRFALSWNVVVFVLDTTKLISKYKIEPYAWNSQFPDKKDHKKEREEYLIVKGNADDYMVHDDGDVRFDVNRFVQPEGMVPHLHTYLLGIFISSRFPTLDDQSLNTITSNPKFFGFR